MLHICWFVVQSAFRNIFDEVTRNSKVQKWMWLTPESVIDDPTGEIGRLASQVHFAGYFEYILFP